MREEELLNQAQQLADQAAAQAEQYSGLLGVAKGYILAYFGPNGLIAACVIVAVICLMLVAKLANLTFSALKFLIIPAVVLALVGSIVLPYSFTVLLPVTATVCSLGLLFRG
jgi:hypothetical protein